MQRDEFGEQRCLKRNLSHLSDNSHLDSHDDRQARTRYGETIFNELHSLV